MKNLVVSICGDESMHKHWVNADPDFDLFVIYYGNIKDKYLNDGILYDKAVGTKFVILYQMIDKHYDFFDQYDAILIPDDDLYITCEDWNRFFSLFHQYQLQLAQPSIMGWQSVPITATNSECILRYTNWVEIMTPCFRKEAFMDVKETFIENKTNWGIEHIWYQILGEPEKDVAIIDDVVAIHTRPCFFGDAYHKNNNDVETALQELKNIGKKYQVELDQILELDRVKKKHKDFVHLASEDRFAPNCQIFKKFISSLREDRKKVFI